MKRLRTILGTGPMAFMKLRFSCPRASIYHATMQQGALFRVAAIENQISIRKVRDAATS